jgi:enoyl-CoA hydratase/carnithine racemase
MAQRSYEHLLYEVDRGRARITLNQPKRRNPLSSALLAELVDALWARILRWLRSRTA